MNDKIEIQGKTVEDAVNEALLRLGARRDEVDVTVLDEPKSGFLGFLGGKPARVEVSRKRSRRRGQRQGNNDDQAHEFGEGSGDSSRRRNSRGRRPRNDRGEREDREGRPERNEQEAAGGRGGRNPRRERQEEETRDRREAGGRSRNDREAGENRQEGESESRSRSRRRRRSRKPRTEGAEAQNQNPNQDGAPENQERGRQERPAAAKVADDQPTESVKDPRRTRGRNQRGRRRAEGGRVDNDSRPTEPMEAVEADGNTIQPETPRTERQERGSRDGRDRGGRRRDNRREDDRRAEPREDSREDNLRDDVIDETIATGIPITKYAEAMRGVGEDEINAAIEKLTGGVLVRAGFPARCEVKDGEYRQVRITIGDDGAAVLIGRHGNTIDSLEHLVERMISTAHGDRVRMNLDVNNYRRRRSDSLTDRVDEAIEQVRSTGKAYHVEPMNARERRLVHLAVEQYEGMRTFTMDSHRGRHVVIALDNSEGDEVETDFVDDELDTTVENTEAVEAAASDEVRDPEVNEDSEIAAAGEEPAAAEAEEVDRQ